MRTKTPSLSAVKHDAPAGDARRSEMQPPRERLLAALAVTERRLTLKSVPTAVLEGGDGPPVLLLHGPGAYGAQWVRVIPALLSSHRVVAPDLPGHGASEMFQGAPDVERVCGWLDELIDRTCPVAPALVGHTLGGAIAARFASAHPRRLSRLVLVDTLGLVPFQPAPEFGAALQAYLASPTEATHEGIWTQCVFDLPAVKRRLGKEWTAIEAYNLATMQRPGGVEALGAWIATFGAPPIPPEELSRIDVPTALIWGRQDRATPLAVAEQASARYGWSLHVIEAAADDPTLDQPDTFVTTLRRVLGS